VYKQFLWPIYFWGDRTLVFLFSLAPPKNTKKKTKKLGFHFWFLSFFSNKDCIILQHIFHSLITTFWQLLILSSLSPPLSLSKRWTNFVHFLQWREELYVCVYILITETKFFFEISDVLLHGNASTDQGEGDSKGGLLFLCHFYSLFTSNRFGAALGICTSSNRE